MKRISSLILFVFSCLLTALVAAADAYQAPRTEWGKPDLQGVWNFSSNVPMQRGINVRISKSSQSLNCKT